MDIMKRGVIPDKSNRCTQNLPREWNGKKLAKTDRAQPEAGFTKNRVQFFYTKASQGKEKLSLKHVTKLINFCDNTMITLKFLRYS